MNFKKWMVFLFVLVMALSFAACGGTDQAAENDANSGADAEKPVYKVAMEPTFPPFDTINAKLRNLTDLIMT